MKSSNNSIRRSKFRGSENRKEMRQTMMLLESRYLIYFFVYENPRDPREPVGRES